jgi:hypothetical protein
MPGVVTSITAALRALAHAVAPPGVLAALGLPPTATNAEAIAANLIARCSSSDADAASVRALLERLADVEPKEPVQVTIQYEDTVRKLLSEEGGEGAAQYVRRMWEYYVRQRLTAEGDNAALAAWDGRMTAAMRLSLWEEIGTGLKSLSEGVAADAETTIQ